LCCAAEHELISACHYQAQKFNHSQTFVAISHGDQSMRAFLDENQARSFSANSFLLGPA
jgi:hypothetical protein